MAVLQKKEYNLAIADFDKAMEINPKENKLYINKGLTYEKEQLYQEAIDTYRTLIINIPEDKASAES